VSVSLTRHTKAVKIYAFITEYAENYVWNFINRIHWYFAAFSAVLLLQFTFPVGFVSEHRYNKKIRNKK
jgi:hypothetical protein